MFCQKQRITHNRRLLSDGIDWRFQAFKHVDHSMADHDENVFVRLLVFSQNEICNLFGFKFVRMCFGNIQRCRF